MNIKKLLAGIVAVTVLSVSMPVFGQEALDNKPVNNKEIIIEDLKDNFSFGSFTATVEEISKEQQSTRINAKDSEDQEVNVMVSAKTFIQGAREIEKADKITVYYNANGPMLAIYPPQYSAEVVVVENGDVNVKVDIFNDELVSEDNNLKLNISDDTLVVDKEGNEFTASLKGEKLIVLYTTSTKSIPAQTTPSKVIVLDSKEEYSIKEDIFDENLLSSDGELKLNVGEDTLIVDEEGKDYEGDIVGKKLRVFYDIVTMSIPPQTPPIKIVVLEDQLQNPGFPDVRDMDLVVGGKILKSNPSYNKKDANNTVMVPLRAVAEGLGFNVKWEDKLSAIMVGDHGSTLNLGDKVYTYLKTTPITLDVAPELRGGKTFVPLNYFTDVQKINNAYVFEGQIVIDNEEKMH